MSHPPQPPGPVWKVTQIVREEPWHNRYSIIAFRRATRDARRRVLTMGRTRVTFVVDIGLFVQRCHEIPIHYLTPIISPDPLMVIKCHQVPTQVCVPTLSMFTGPFA